MKLSQLPLTLVPFTAYFAPAGKLVWHQKSKNLDQSLLLKSYSYTVKSKHSLSKTFYADCYGGGLAGNGGSARCGYDFQYQVKGIGVTPLLGRRADQYHSSGKLSLQQALVEVIWSEVLSQACPHGVIHPIAVIDLNSKIEGQFFDRSDREALLIREAPVRLAHLERAFRFIPQLEHECLIPRDADRVKLCIGILEEILNGDLVIGREGPLHISTIEVLKESVRRMAAQLAYAHVNLIKLTTSPSNIEINGKILDVTNTFCMWGMATSEPEKYYRYHRGAIGEQKSILNCLDNICYYIKKYRPDIFSKNLHAELRSAYAISYIHQLDTSVLIKVGFPPRLISLISTDTQKKIRGAYIKCVLDSNSIIFKSTTDNLPLLYKYVGSRYSESTDVFSDHLENLFDETLVQGIVDAIKEVEISDARLNKRWSYYVQLRIIMKFIFLPKFCYTSINHNLSELIQSSKDGSLTSSFELLLSELIYIGKACFSEVSDEIHLLASPAVTLQIDEKRISLTVYKETDSPLPYYELKKFISCEPLLWRSIEKQYPKKVTDLIANLLDK